MKPILKLITAAVIGSNVIAFGTGPTFAGGFLFDQLDLANQAFAELESAHKNLDQAADSTKRVIAQQSNSCVTPRQVCELPKSTLHGTTCFCGTDDFGRAQ